jgi:predicted DNA-binding transcriptional regulator AlpA
MSEFVAATAQQALPGVRINDNAPVTSGGTLEVGDAIDLTNIQLEFGLKPPQVAKLQRRFGFPTPIRRGRPLQFSRREIEEWASGQPNRDNLGIILRSRKRRRQPNK